MSDKLYWTQKTRRNLYPFILITILGFFVGVRPIDGVYLGDTWNYAKTYEYLQSGLYEFNNSVSNEPVWDFIMQFCADAGWSVHTWFTIIAFLFLGITLMGLHKYLPKNEYVALLFFISAYSFWGSAVNGIRSSLALAVVMLLPALLCQSTRDRVVAIVLAICAFYIHTSSALPMLCMLFSYMFLKDIRTSVKIWIISIFASLIAGGFFESFFAGLGFDDRMSEYLIASKEAEKMSQFSSSGFRFDFLLYSIPPILLGYYVTIKRGIYDKMYILLLNTYILSNAFWILVIRASFSNRFAGLSWFLYPILLAYPLLRLPVWHGQGRKTALALLLSIGFTVFMALIGK